jgi:hypothetical protein
MAVAPSVIARLVSSCGLDRGRSFIAAGAGADAGDVGAVDARLGDSADVRTAVTFERRAPQVAALVAHTYGLTARKRRVTECVARRAGPTAF